MSETSLHHNWVEARAPLAEHIELLETGIKVIQAELIAPDDGRFEAAYVALATGAGKIAVMAIGEPGTGKTQFGNMVIGQEAREDISPDDVTDTLFGYTSPFDPNKIVPGKFASLKEDQVCFANEIGNLRNTRPVLSLWDGDVVRLGGAGGELVDITNAAYYMTSNFPEGQEYVHELDDALASRTSLQILTGDHDKAARIAVHAFAETHQADTSQFPLLPPAAVRASMHQQLKAKYPVTPRGALKNAQYLEDLLERLTVKNRVTVTGAGDARLSSRLYDAARARMLVSKLETGEHVKPENLAAAAALVLPKMVKVSPLTRMRFEAEAGRPMTPIEKAIAIRRIVAQTAFSVAVDEPYAGKPMSRDDRIDLIRRSGNAYSYANSAAAGRTKTGEALSLNAIIFSNADPDQERQTVKVGAGRGRRTR